MIDDKTIGLYGFHIILEARIRSVTIQCKKYHPEWDRQQIKEVLAKIVDIAYEKEHLKDGEKNVRLILCPDCFNANICHESPFRVIPMTKNNEQQNCIYFRPKEGKK